MKVTTVAPIQQPDVHVEMSYEDAKFLMMIFGSTGGNPSNPIRKVTERFYEALRQAGISYQVHERIMLIRNTLLVSSVTA